MLQLRHRHRLRKHCHIIVYRSALTVDLHVLYKHLLDVSKRYKLRNLYLCPIRKESLCELSGPEQLGSVVLEHIGIWVYPRPSVRHAVLYLTVAFRNLIHTLLICLYSNTDIRTFTGNKARLRRIYTRKMHCVCVACCLVSGVYNLSGITHLPVPEQPGLCFVRQRNLTHIDLCYELLRRLCANKHLRLLVAHRRPALQRI